jgi:prenyltransferase beta subunit
VSASHRRFHLGERDMTSRPQHLRLVIVVLIVIGSGMQTARSQPAPAKPTTGKSVETSGLKLVTPETKKSISSGLRFLAARQHDDGSFGSGSIYQQNVAVTSLCGLAFLSGGHTPGRGKYGVQSQKAVDFVLSRCRPNGYIVDEDSTSHGPMYGHGFATLFLAEAYGMTHRKDLRVKLGKAIKLIVNTQNKDGGWRYKPQAEDADVSVTVCQMMALRAARNCGISIPKETVDRCVGYLKKAQNSDGGYKYQLTRQSDSLFPRSAAATVALYNAGVFKGKELEHSLRFLLRSLPRGDVFRYESHYYYGHYYAVQAMWHAGGEYWRQWYPAIRNELLRRQLSNGGWRDPSICDEYSTAMACLVLQMPNNYLPIFQR